MKHETWKEQERGSGWWSSAMKEKQNGSWHCVGDSEWRAWILETGFWILDFWTLDFCIPDFCILDVAASQCLRCLFCNSWTLRLVASSRTWSSYPPRPKQSMDAGSTARRQVDCLLGQSKACLTYSLWTSEIRLGDSASERRKLCIEFWSGWDCESWTSVPRAIIDLQ